jgi:asparagine synthase (glutamine-hydrolysing)
MGPETSVRSRRTDLLDSRALELRGILEESVRRHRAECILLSGGLDTCVLAHLASPHGLRAGVTVLVEPDAPDGPFASAVARRLGLRHHVVVTDPAGLLAEAEIVVRTLVTFDPMEVRNSIVVARALREARRLGYDAVFTGDGADELFAGYSYMWSKPSGEFERYSEYLARVMRFSSIPLGKALGVDVHTPYLDPAVVGFALRLGKDAKVGEREGSTHGKLLLRLAFPDLEASWRRKDPIEVGSGSACLPAYFQERISIEDLAAEKERIAREDRVQIRDAEHLAYYRIFQRVFGDTPPRSRYLGDCCSKCGFPLPTPETTFCVTCGAWPAR